ncbi:hypothetical protein H7J88_28770 [Mycolicibacterium flavescens]|uniref:hypothetical protein n=1 Tax=Mycolicibacterium flavescens TaxID=1776 RepID=UPI0013F4D987|nr:hypothetical protein [Mycolicibacterium flavescens]MCV7283633.1 hypothetical protein [Mycolicibacterium flavescens]
MRKFGIAAMIASFMTATLVGFAGPAQAGVDHLDWLDKVHPTVNVPQVDTTVRHSR